MSNEDTYLHSLTKNELIHLIMKIQEESRQKFERELSDRRLLATFCNSCGWTYMSTHKWQNRSDGYCNYCKIENDELPPKNSPEYRIEFTKLQEKRYNNKPKFPPLYNEMK